MRAISSKALLIGVTVLMSACGSENPPPAMPPADAGADDADDAGVRPDAPRDPTDAGFVRTPLAPNDPGVVDPQRPVVGIADGGGVDDGGPDGSVSLLDTDQDLISDLEEGGEEVDTDRDGIPDFRDIDSDNDGILDRQEAGDRDLRTPAVDTDGDGIPDFRDLDSDDDTLLDADEGLVDPDSDGRPAYVDVDADGDDILDRVEGAVDTDDDGLPDFLDRDSDGDTLDDKIETDQDTDGDGSGNWRDLDSDGDGLSDALEGLSDPDGDGAPAFVDLDADGDGLSDELEGAGDTDGDGRGAWLDVDSDGDTIRDATERLADPDTDGIPAYLDLDADGDGLPDRVEAGDANLATPPGDPDGDGTPSYLDLDADDDTILDAVEGAADQDADGEPSFVDLDSDGDGLSDATEAGDSVLATPPIDTDRDGFADYVDPDSDNDLIRDAHEGLSDGDGDGLPDYRDLDADGDGRADASEAGDGDVATAPIDTDGDGIADFRDIDSDNDGFGDAAEVGCPVSTDHLAPDSDLDGLVDPIEVAVGTDPCDARSVVAGLFFVLPPLAPTQNATLAFDRTEIDRADLVLNVDTTGSMGGEIITLRTSLTSIIIPGLQAAVADPGFAVTSFEDYPVAPFGAFDVRDRPFRLLSRVTTNSTAAQSAVNGLTIRNGLDLPESGLQALYQIATGAGTAWGTGVDERVPPFDSAVGLLPGVADGTIGGVGFRPDALPIVVHVTDATSHFATTYLAVSPAIDAVPTSSVRMALADIGARVISVASAPLPRPVAATQTAQWFSDSCRRRTARFFGRIESPSATDVDWFALTGVAAGATVNVEITAARIGSTLDSVLAVYDGTGARLALNDDLAGMGTPDSGLSVTLAGTAPFYVAVSSYNDLDFDGVDAITSGYYFLDVLVDGVGYTPSDPTCPGIDLGVTRAAATPLGSLTSAAAGPAMCEDACSAEIEDEPLALPYGIAQSTGAVIEPCAWDAFGTRPAACAANQCCTGPGGSGQAVNAAGRCPLSFEIDADGTGLGDAIVTGIDALVRFSTFEITASVRGDPDALANRGVDTRCFIHGVVPTVAVTPNACAPTPVAASDRWTNVVPGTELTFRIDARNKVATGTTACVVAERQPVAFRAYVDLWADGVTKVDTREVTIVVPAQPTPTGN